MGERLCACGCGHIVEGKREYFDNACKNRAWRRRNGIKEKAYKEPAPEPRKTSRGYIAKIRAAVDPRTHRYDNIASKSSDGRTAQ